MNSSGPVLILARAFVDAVVATAVFGPLDVKSWTLFSPDTADVFGKAIVAANVLAALSCDPDLGKSEPEGVDWLEPYVFPGHAPRLKVVEALAALDLIQTHSAGPGWAGSDTESLVNHMRNRLMREIPGYDKVSSRMMKLAEGTIHAGPVPSGDQFGNRAES